MGAVGREALDQPMAHGVGGLEADAAALDLVGGAGRVVERRRADHVLTDSIARRRSVPLSFAMSRLKAITRSSAFMLPRGLRG